jgi:TolB-like protein
VAFLLIEKFGEDDAPVTDKSVAVLPFVAMSSGPDDEYFADGLTEEILNSLAGLPDLLVTARTSAFHFKGQDLPPIPEIAAILGVAHIVEGSVRRDGERLRVTAQLIRAADSFHLWSENYNHDTTDTFAVQSDIAEKIATARGDAHTTTALVDQYRNANHVQQINVLARAGERELANQKAAEADASQYGHMVLATNVIVCQCGAPFDLESTPNFAKLLQDADLPWPPDSPINWPLKDW